MIDYLRVKTGVLAEISYHDRPNQPRKIVVEQDDKITKYRLVNIVPEKPIYAGDELKLENAGGMKFGGRAEPLVEERGADNKLIVFDEPGRFKMRRDGQIRTRLKISITKPPEQNPLKMDLQGLGLYWEHSVDGMWGDSMRQWLELTAAAGLNYHRIIGPSTCWQNGNDSMLYDRFFDDLYDIEHPVEERLRRWRADCWYARRLGIVIHFDMWDGHFMRDFPECWANSEYNGINNTLNYPLPSDYEKPSSDSPWRKVVEHSLTQQNMDELSIRYGRAILRGKQAQIEKMPKGHMGGDGNEIDKRSTSCFLLCNINYPVKSFGGQALRDPLGVEFVNNDHELMSRVQYICVHALDLHNITEKVSIVMPLCKRWNVKILGSTDGSRRKPIPDSPDYRERIGRIPFRDLPKIRDAFGMAAGIYYGGCVADIKIHNGDDTRALLEYYAALKAA